MHDSSLVVLLVGVLIALSVFLHIALRRLTLPPLVGFILLGFGLRALGEPMGMLTEQVTTSLQTAAELGIAALLFKVGLETNLAGLLSQLSRATWLWLGNVVVSGGLAFLVAWKVLGLGVLAAMFIGAALSATSVGISVSAWRDAGVLRTKTGELLIDVAELDDISGVVFVAVLFSIAPLLLAVGSGEVGTGALTSAVTGTLGWLLVKGAIFGGGCYVFSRYIERRMTSALQQVTRGRPELGEVVLATGLIIAALAGWLGFSVAIGALFAGVLFSNDPACVREEGLFSLVYDLLSPFFFIGIGLQLDPSALVSGLALGAPLLVVAVVGKVLGTWLPGIMVTGGQVGLLLGVSLIPRAEIALIIMKQGESLGADAVAPEVYAAMVVVSACTCLCAPFAVRGMLRVIPVEREAPP